MRTLLMRCRVPRGTALVFTLIAGLVSSAASQVTELAARGPRFLAISPKDDRPVDARNAAILQRRVSFRVTRVTTRAVLDEIGRQANLRFVYSDDLVRLDRKISLEIKHLTVAAVLTEILLETGLDVLVLRAGQLGLVQKGLDPSNYRQGGTLTGVVKDAKNGQPVVGAEVFLARTNWKSSVDTAGRYRLGGVDAGSYILTIRRLGYAKYTRDVTVREEREDTVDAVLDPVAVPLNELITTATGRQRRRDIGNAITTINADSVMRTAPIRNLTDLLKGRVPGLTVRHTSGAPGDPARLRLRGLGSVMRGNDPVIIVDGIRVYAAQSETRSGNLANRSAPAPSPIDQIDPNTIEKIESFKGPSAATLYGADAANGVIVVTTKMGRPGPAQWSTTWNQGRTTTPGRWPEGYFRFGHWTLATSPHALCPITQPRCVMDSLVRFQALNQSQYTILGTGTSTGLSLTASGGSQMLTYSLTGSYDSETGLLTLPEIEAVRFQDRFKREAPGWMKRPHALKTWNVTSNVRARLSGTADVILSASLFRSEQQRSSLEKKVATLAGTYITRDNILGLVYQIPQFISTSPHADYFQLVPSDFLGAYYERTTASAINFRTGLDANWNPRPWLSVSGQAGLNIVPRDDQYALPAGLTSATDSGAFTRGTGRSIVSTVNFQSRLRKPLGWGFVFETSLGANVTTTDIADLTSAASGLVPGTSSINGAQRLVGSEFRSSTSVFGYYVEPRVSGQRLSLSTGFRLDGGSAYGARLTTSGGRGLLGSLLALPKLNGSWVISEEPFFPFKQLFSSFRIRGAYGQAQVQPGPADRLRLYRGSNQSGRELNLINVGNADLRPERSVEFEGGFDADLLDGRLGIDFTAYRKTQIDALMPVSLPGSVNGGGTIISNIGNIRNTGVELMLDVTPVRHAALTWHTRLTYSRNTNTLVKLGRGVLPNARQGIVEGYPVSSRWAQPILGFSDQNNDGVLRADEIQVGDSLVFMGRLYPAYQTSLSTDLMLLGGSIALTADFSYDAGATQINETARNNWVLVRALSDPGAPFSEQASVQAYVSGRSEYGLIQDISTFRFTTLSASYRAPSRVTRLFGARQMSITVSGSNLALHSTYEGKDPDVNAWSSGETIVDAGQLPQPRTWRFSVRLEY